MVGCELLCCEPEGALEAAAEDVCVLSAPVRRAVAEAVSFVEALWPKLIAEADDHA